MALGRHRNGGGFAPAQPADRTVALRAVAVKTLTTRASSARACTWGKHSCPLPRDRRAAVLDEASQLQHAGVVCRLLPAGGTVATRENPARAPMEFGGRAASMTPTTMRRQ